MNSTPASRHPARWQEMVDDRARPGNWVPLPENGLGALMAFAAGAGYARPAVGMVPRPIRVTLERPGSPPVYWEEERGSEDTAIIIESIAEYLAEAGIAAAPLTAWEILLPEGVTGADLEQRTGKAMARTNAGPGGPLTHDEVDAIVRTVQEAVQGS
ncbi:DUF5956 family protein [Occultella gossypii]|uniref:Uncharacterized protein n=1 Tax=Occultella gossypii TaxID=2800820 RepID=A0ABS7S7J2_9MICO|nr:DUF5956 family protein [Occultella gossypii]MBZ2195266.1 hypothetical protein [Occultella gossypii]